MDIKMDFKTKQKVLDYLMAGGVVSQLNGMEVAQTTCIKDYCGFLIRDDHIPIRKKWATAPSGKRYKIYWLEKETQLTFAEVR